MEITHKKINAKELRELEYNRNCYIDDINRIDASEIWGEKCVGALKHLVQEYDEKISPLKTEWEERIKFWKDNLFKYFKVTFKNCGNYEDNIYIFPYKLLMSNEKLFVVVNLNDNYLSGLKDNTMDFSYFYKYDYTAEEITKEEFLTAANENVERPLKIRLEKLKNRNEFIE